MKYKMSFCMLWAVGLSASAVAQAQSAEWEIDARMTVAVGDSGDQAVGVPEADGFAGEAVMTASREAVLDNGLALEWRGEVRISRDAPGRRSFSGVFGDCSAGLAGCPAVGSGVALVSPVSPATGLSVGGVGASEGVAVFVEGASLSASGPWGEGVFGLDSGVAARLDARAPQVLDAVSAYSSSLDPVGLGVVRARNDVTGSSLKASYMSPRWLGLRLGVSYAPEANLFGADFDPTFDVPGAANADLENVIEGALSFSRRFRSNGVLVRAALTGTSAESGSSLAGFDDYSAVGAGLELEKGSWTGGFRWLSSNNAAFGDDARYQAWEVGLVRESGNWRFGLEAGFAEDGQLGLDGQSWLVGAQRSIGENVSLGLAYMDVRDKFPVNSGTYERHKIAQDGILLELSVRK